jgi:hypothetical protein
MAVPDRQTISAAMHAPWSHAGFSAVKGAADSFVDTGRGSPSNRSLQEGWASCASADMLAAPLNTLLAAVHPPATHAGSSAVL